MPHELDWFFLYGALSHIHLMTASIPPWVGVPLGIIAMALAFATAFYVGYNWISLLTRRAERSFALGYARMTVALALATVPVVANFPLFLFWIVFFFIMTTQVQAKNRPQRDPPVKPDISFTDGL